MMMQRERSTGTERVAIVTGGSRGVSREITRRLARQGYAVVVVYAVNQVAADQAVEEVLAANGLALTVRADLGDALDVERLFVETIAAFRGVDVVVHTAGGTARAPIADSALDAFDGQYRLNVRGTFAVNQRAAREVRDGGAIVNVSCNSANVGLPADVASAASRGAIEAMTRVFARELHERDVTVNAVACGSDGRARAVADVVAFLAGSQGRGLNGQLIEVADGVASEPAVLDRRNSPGWCAEPETRASPGASTGARACQAARPSDESNPTEVTMSSTDVSTDSPTPLPGASEMWLEVVVLPVSDVERARAFYETTMGWRLDANLKGDDRWVVQVTPPGSLCSIWVGTGITSAAPGSSQGMILAVRDLDATRDALVARGVAVSEVFHRGGTGVVPGADPEGRSYMSFASFSDPDGNGWLLQEIKTRLPGR